MNMHADPSLHPLAADPSREKETYLRRSLPLCRARCQLSDPLLVSRATRSLAYTKDWLEHGSGSLCQPLPPLLLHSLKAM
jgi:hypothetical protein